MHACMYHQFNMYDYNHTINTLVCHYLSSIHNQVFRVSDISPTVHRATDNIWEGTGNKASSFQGQHIYALIPAFGNTAWRST